LYRENIEFGDLDDVPPSSLSQIDNTNQPPGKLIEFLMKEAKYWKERAQSNEDKLQNYQKLETTNDLLKQDNEKLNTLAFNRVKEITDLKSEINSYKREIDGLKKLI